MTRTFMIKDSMLLLLYEISKSHNTKITIKIGVSRKTNLDKESNSNQERTITLRLTF